MYIYILWDYGVCVKTALAVALENKVRMNYVLSVILINKENYSSSSTG